LVTTGTNPSAKDRVEKVKTSKKTDTMRFIYTYQVGAKIDKNSEQAKEKIRKAFNIFKKFTDPFLYYFQEFPCC
jgi:hypothetical protein